MLNFCIRVVCLLTASLMATHALSQDLSGWSDKTVCRLASSQRDDPQYPLYLIEAKNRELNCGSGVVKNHWATITTNNITYIKGVSEDQWAIIERIGDPLNCKERIKRIKNVQKSKTITAEEFLKNGDIIQEYLATFPVVKLENGQYQLTDPIRVPAGKILLGTQDTNILADKVSVAIFNKGAISNLLISNAKEHAVILVSNSDVYNVVVRNTGVSKTINDIGNGIDSNGLGSSGNCLVSVEVSHGYNERGTSHKTEKGGNADGFAVRNGAHDITFIDTHAHHNSDDGYDFWKGGANASISKDKPTIRIFYSSANFNGKNPLTPNGDGNGFKLGSGDGNQKNRGKDKGSRLIHGSVPCFNASHGFDRNKTSTDIIASNLNTVGNKKGFIEVSSSRTITDPQALKCSMFPTQ